MAGLPEPGPMGVYSAASALDSSPTPSESADGRCLRQSTRERKHYSDEPLNDDDIEGKRTFSLEEHLNTDVYSAEYVQVMETGEKFDLRYIQEYGLCTPLLFREKTGLGMRVPSKNFKVSDVKQCVGSRRHLDVMDVNTQKGLEMTMKDWVRYYENPNRDRLLNVISLEFSHTKLENYVESPTVVRQIDWVDAVWPRHLKECQTESTNLMHHMKYPKVQKYCLMSVKGCYTDFHIDFGGTSVWYHILHGEKIFWLIPPSPINLKLYEDWLMSGRQGDMFFGTEVQGCQRVRLVEGNTFMIPTGWIHAVYTPMDSLVFGGNFLHSYSIPMQLKIYEVEDRTRVPGKFRYPFMGEILWYVLDRYVACLKGKSHRTLSAAELKRKAEEAERERGLLSPKLKTESSPKKDFIETKAEILELASLKAAATDPEISHSLEQLLATPKTDAAPDVPPKPGPGSPRVYITSVKTAPVEMDVQTIGAMGDAGASAAVTAPPLEPPVQDLAAGPHTAPPDYQIMPLPASQTAPNQNSGCNVTGPHESSFSQSVLPPPAPLNGQDGADAPLTVLHIPDEQEASPVPATPVLSPPIAKPQGCKYLTTMEIDGLRALIKYVSEMPASKAPVPKDISDPVQLLQDAKSLLAEHENDDQSLAISGEPTIFWPGAGKSLKTKGIKTPGPKQPKLPKNKDKDKDPNSSVRRRRTRCKKCEACTRQDCGECHFCKDMRKFGGMGRMKQSCISRQCMAPVLPNTAICSICQKEERVKTREDEPVATLMECGICWEIVHPQCLIEKYENLDNNGNINEDLPNSWECPKCCHDGKRGQLKPRVPKGVSKIGKSEHVDQMDDDVTIVSVKQEVVEEADDSMKEEAGSVPYAPYQDLKPNKPAPHPLSTAANTENSGKTTKPNEFFIDPEPLPKRRRMSENESEEVKPAVAAERFVVRPAPISPASTQVQTSGDGLHQLDRNLWMKIFRYLGPHDLYMCMQVCKSFDRWCLDRSFWRSIDLTDSRLTKDILVGVVKRQPSSLILAKTNVSSKQLFWFLSRLPLLKSLDLSYCSWSAVSALTLGCCPWLEKLRLDWVEGLGDDELSYLLTHSVCQRPGVKDGGDRLRNLVELSLVGTDITGGAIALISHHLTSLVRLDLSHCPAVTTNSFDSPTKSPTFSQLNTVLLAGCRKLNSSILDFLNRLPGVKRVDLTGCSQITDAHIMLFNEANRSHPFRTLSGKILYRE